MNFLKDINIIFKKIELPIVYSNDLKSIFALMNDTEDVDIKIILGYINYLDGVYFEYTLFDVVDNNTISFASASRLDRMNDSSENINNIFSRYCNSNEYYGWHKQRTTMSIGRFLTKILDKLEEVKTNFKANNVHDSVKEKFINSFKSNYIVLKQGVEELFFTVSGEEIRNYYYEKSYMSENGQLGSSCMRFKSCGKYLDIYVRNPEVCKLLCLKAPNGKIRGRAILWTLDNGEQFLDRIYTNNDSDINLFGTYINKMGIKYSHRFNYLDASINLIPIEYDMYPYMDTFRFYQPSTGLITNNVKQKKLYNTGEVLELRNTNGEITGEFELTNEECEADYLPF